MNCGNISTGVGDLLEPVVDFLPQHMKVVLHIYSYILAMKCIKKQRAIKVFFNFKTHVLRIFPRLDMAFRISPAVVTPSPKAHLPAAYVNPCDPFVRLPRGESLRVICCGDLHALRHEIQVTHGAVMGRGLLPAANCDMAVATRGYFPKLFFCLNVFFLKDTIY